MEFLKDVGDILFFLCPTKSQEVVALHKKLKNTFPVRLKTIMAFLIPQNEMIEITREDLFSFDIVDKTAPHGSLQCFPIFIIFVLH